MILNVLLIIINDCSCNSAISNLSVPNVATYYQVTFFLILRKKTLTIKPAFLTKAQEPINFEIMKLVNSVKPYLLTLISLSQSTNFF